MHGARRKIRRSVAIVTAALALLAASASSAWATPPELIRDGQHHEVTTRYFPDDICGARSGWTTFDMTWHLRVTAFENTYQANYVETGTYSTDLDDPAFEDYTSQLTEAVHLNLTKGGTAITTVQQHDFPGSIRIRVQVVFVAGVDGVRVDRDILEVSGCP